MDRIALLGLGRMGLPIAERLARMCELVAFDPDPARRNAARAADVPLSESAVTAVATADVLVTVLPGAAAQRGALLGPDGVLSSMAAGALLLELTSGDPSLSRDIAAAAAARDVAYVAAPMAGGPTDAAGGTLGFFAAGAPGAIARARGVLEPLGEGVTVIGDEPADAQTVKLLVNALWFGQAALAGEVMALGVRAGLDARALLAVLQGSAAGGTLLDRHLPHVLEGDYLASFGVDGIIEELDAVLAEARRLGVPDDVLQAVADRHRAARERFGAVDGELISVRLAEERTGVRLQSRPAAD